MEAVTNEQIDEIEEQEMFTGWGDIMFTGWGDIIKQLAEMLGEVHSTQGDMVGIAKRNNGAVLNLNTRLSALEKAVEELEKQ